MPRHGRTSRRARSPHTWRLSRRDFPYVTPAPSSQVLTAIDDEDPVPCNLAVTQKGSPTRISFFVHNDRWQFVQRRYAMVTGLEQKTEHRESDIRAA